MTDQSLETVLGELYKGEVIGEFMITHEQSIHDFAMAEAAGKTETSIDNVVKVLITPLPPPNRSGSATAE